MKPAIAILFCSQVLFSISDLLARYFLRNLDFGPAAFLHPWILAYFGVRVFAVTGVLYAYTEMELGKTRAIAGAVSIIFANVLGLLVLGEVLSLRMYVGTLLAVIAFFILSVR